MTLPISHRPQVPFGKTRGAEVSKALYDFTNRTIRATHSLKQLSKGKCSTHTSLKAGPQRPRLLVAQERQVTGDNPRGMEKTGKLYKKTPINKM